MCWRSGASTPRRRRQPTASGVSQGGRRPRGRQQPRPATQLRAYYRQDRGAELPEAIGALFTQLYEETLRATA